MLSIIIACLVGGVAFAALAVVLTRSKGNTLKDMLNSEAFKNKAPEAFQVEFDLVQKKIKGGTQFPIVGLYLVSAFVALGIPVWMISHPTPSGECEEGEITLSGTIRKSSEGNVYLIPTDLKIEPSGFFRIALKKNEVKRDYNIESERYSPVTLNVEYGKRENKLYINLNNVAGDTLAIDTSRNTASLLRPIELAPRSEMAVANRVTPEPARPGITGVGTGGGGDDAQKMVSFEP